MPLRPALIAEIQAALGAAVNPSLTVTSAANDIFEAYILSLVINAARAEGATISFMDVFGNTPTTYVFRTSPGHIFLTTQPYCHTVIEFPNKPTLEAHIGIYVGGKSRVFHECDVAVLFQEEADLCRLNNVPPRHSQVLISIECKHYTVGLKLDLARSFMGLSSDLTTKNSFFVVNSASSSIEKLLTHHDKNWEHEVRPGSTNAVARLNGALQKAFRNFKTKF